MGEIADMMLDGTLCQECGVYIDQPGAGVPRSCSDCKRDSTPKKKRKRGRRGGKKKRGTK